MRNAAFAPPFRTCTMAAASSRRKYKAVLLGEPGVGKSTLFATVLKLKMNAGRQNETGRKVQTPHREGYGTEVNYTTEVGDTGVTVSCHRGRRVTVFHSFKYTDSEAHRLTGRS